MKASEDMKEYCKIMDMDTIDIVEYLEAYAAEHDLPTKIRRMIDVLKVRLELGIDEDAVADDEEEDDDDGLDFLTFEGMDGNTDSRKLAAIHAYAVGMTDAITTMTDFINCIVIPEEVLEDLEEDES